MLVSCIIVSHNKPDLCHEAIRSITAQTYKNWECVVVDSGVLYDQGYFSAFPQSFADERLIFIRSAETAETRRTKAMAPWCFNECFRNGWVKGDLIIYLTDDDIYYPNAFETFASYATANPDALAMYASQDIGIIYPDGRRAVVGERRAIHKAGMFCGGVPMDCHVDYAQMCHRRSVLQAIDDSEWWPEGKDTETHADGVFMERIGLITTFYPIDIKVSQNRRTPKSTYAPSR